MMKKLIERFLQIGCALFLVCALAPVNAFGQVTVYAEAAYTESDLAVYIYSDITAPTELRSAGVKLTYDDSVLTVVAPNPSDPKATAKNEDVWFLGEESYMDPDTSTSGEVVIILGKLDTAAPSEGVSGERVLLAKVRFTRSESSIPFSPTLGLALGKVHPNHPTDKFANFVDTEDPANMLDETGVSFTTPINDVHERGDANGDGNINAVDYVAIRNNLNSTDAAPYMDCNDDGAVNVVDYVCVRNKI
jgi:hypothetical protein